ncbi:MAG: DegV family EDD domain-containing protein [Desulfobulbaceae bacterium]|jgi:DegV family protein with EDD domain|nr:DegV family EDD domain-containing protein [Desulfobulbaceae bacterium]
MSENFNAALAAGYAALVAKAKLLDAINVFPVADADTGANLRASLAPLSAADARLGERLPRAACGNSGNIAAAFFSVFADIESSASLAERARLGAARARAAVAAPKAGTMLDVFDKLTAELAKRPSLAKSDELLAALAAVVRETVGLLPRLRQAGVVDSGALAMYIFFDGFFAALFGERPSERPLAATFPGLLTVADEYAPTAETGFCIDALLETGDTALDARRLADLGDSLVLLPTQGDKALKLHMHSGDPAALRERLAQVGRIVTWSETSLNAETTYLPDRRANGVQIVTDAAASLSHSLAAREHITLLESLILLGGEARPEGEVDAQELYRRMRLGEKVGTAQASLWARQQALARLRGQGRCLYLAVGSAYTGNWQAADAWLTAHPAGAALVALDSGAASGRLAVMAILLARYAKQVGDLDRLVDYAKRLGATCQEFLCIDNLHWLAAGGRVSKTGELLGNFLRLKPIICPMPEGVRKLGVFRGRAGQLAFVESRLARLSGRPGQAAEKKVGRALALLQHTDNRAWLETTLPPLVRSYLPDAEIHILPLSLTTGAHIGPGGWSVAVGYPPPETK